MKSRYCHLVDSRRWDELAEPWTEDATCDYGFFGAYEGRDEIVSKFFGEMVESASSFMVHMVHNPLIELAGDGAKGTWYLTAQTTNQPAKRGRLGHGLLPRRVQADRRKLEDQLPEVRVPVLHTVRRRLGQDAHVGGSELTRIIGHGRSPCEDAVLGAGAMTNQRPREYEDESLHRGREDEWLH